MSKLASSALFALALLGGSAAVATADATYEPYFQNINRCVGGYLVQTGMTCIYAFAACEGQRGPASEMRDVHMALSCRINADGTCPAAFECSRDRSFSHVSNVYSTNPSACSRGARNVECRWQPLLQR